MGLSGGQGGFSADQTRALRTAERALRKIPAHGPASAIFDAIRPCAPVAAGMLSVLRPRAADTMVNHGVRVPYALLDAWMSAPPEHLAHALGPILAAPAGALLRDAETIHGDMREQLEALRALGAHGLGEGAGYKIGERISPAHGPEHVMLTLLTERGATIEAHAKALLGALNPAIQAAVRRIELPFVAHKPLFAQIFAEQGQGYVCVSPSGSVLESNRRAHELAARYPVRAGAQRHALADLARDACARPPGAGPWRIRGKDGFSMLQVQVHQLDKVIHALAEDIRLVSLIEWTPFDDLGADERFARLTERQRQIALRLARGLSYKEIAVDLDIEEGTVRKHTEQIYRALGVHARAELLRLFTWPQAPRS